MSRIEWDAIGERLYETGVEQGVLYPWDAELSDYGKGVGWNGLTAVNENPSGAEATKIYADNINYLNLYSKEDFGASIEAYMYPDEFGACDGSAEIADGVYIGQQNRKLFGFAYKTLIGSDTEDTDYGYKLHLLYGCKASPSEKAYSTVNDSPEAATMSWEVTTTPINVAGYKPTANLTINSKKVDDDKLKLIEDALYGVDADEFSEASKYAVGDYVSHVETEVEKFYRCKTAITTPGAWDESKWDEVDTVDPHLLKPAEVLAILNPVTA